MKKIMKAVLAAGPVLAAAVIAVSAILVGGPASQAAAPAGCTVVLSVPGGHTQTLHMRSSQLVKKPGLQLFCYRDVIYISYKP